MHLAQDGDVEGLLEVVADAGDGENHHHADHGTHLHHASQCQQDDEF